MMFGLPPSTEQKMIVAKQKFYEQTKISSTLKKLFEDQIHSIRLQNIFSVNTLNIAAGRCVDAIMIIEIQLRADRLDDKILRLIDKAMPAPIIFVLSRGNWRQACAAYKEGSTVGKYFKTDWFGEDQLTLNLHGLTLDEVYENFFRQIIGEKSLQGKSFGTLKGALFYLERIQKLEKQIDSLQRKIRSEKQFNRQFELNDRLKKLQMELEMLRRGEVGA